VKEETTGF